MICVAVREELTERALGSLDEQHAAEIDQHLRECAACRREARDLQKAAATLGFALAPAAPPSDLEQRVASTVKKQADRRFPTGRSLRRLAGPGIAAALLFLFAVTTTVMMMGRARELGRENQALQDSRTQALNRLKQLAGTEALTDPSLKRAAATLSAVPGRSGTATAVATFSALGSDVVVVLSGVSQGIRTDFPYTIKLQATRRSVIVGEIYGVDETTSATLSRHFDRDLSQFTRAVLVDAEGRVLLRGTMTTGTSPIFGG